MFCREQFPGHQAIVCTHPDGHNQSGNIHVHTLTLNDGIPLDRTLSSNEGASGKTAPKWSAPQASSVGRMVDREAKRAEGKGIGYDRWASMHNLKA